MELWHRSMLQALGRLRSEQLLREAEEWRAARLASQTILRQRSGLARAVAWWRAHLSRRRAQRVPLAEQERS
jgi:hypothetical protein